MNSKRLGMISAAALVASSLVGAAVVAGPVASAADAPCVATFTPNPVASGAPFALTVTGFDPSEHVAVVGLVGGEPAVSFIAQADSSGTYASGDQVDGPVVFVFTFTGQQSSITCGATLTVLAATTTTSGDPASSTTSSTAPPAAAKAVTAKPAFTG